MWLNQQTVDAIRIMAELGLTFPRRVRASDLPEPTGITFMNVQKTVHALGVAGLVETQRGRAGGIRLARAPETIAVGEIVRAFEPTDCPVSFLETSVIESNVSRLLFQAHRGFFAPLETTTLDSLLPAVMSA
jgi:Rrf2 family transcriptional regulator, nitric oxide-sensitive transcriptional repressor